MNKMFTHEVDIEKVNVKQPKRYDNFMAGKISYNDEKFVLDLPHVKLLSNKSSNETLYCKFKLSREQEKFFIDMEEKFVSLTTENVAQWFKSKMNQDTVDEFFTSALNFNKKHRSVLKLRIESSTAIPEADLVNTTVDIKLRVASIRFLKTSWWLCYDLIECTPSQGLSFQTDDEDDTASVLAIEDIDAVGPDFEEREEMRQRYVELLEENARACTERLRRVEELLGIIRGSSVSLSAFDAIENLLG